MQGEASGVWQGKEKGRADRPRLHLFMCQTSGDDGSSVSSRTSSDSSDHSGVLPLPVPSFDKSGTYPAAGWWPPPRTSRGAVVALVCTFSAAVSLSLYGGFFGGLYSTNNHDGGKHDGSLLKLRNRSDEEVSAQSIQVGTSRVAVPVACRKR